MKVLVVYCHPNPDSLVAAARDNLIAGLEHGGHEVRLTDLYADGFSPEFTAEERATHIQPGIIPSLQHYADDLSWADALALVYPTWWGGPPAMLKGWFDRVWVAGVAWRLPPGKTNLRPLLTNIKRIIVVTTHGSSKITNSLQGEPGKRTIIRAMRLMCSRRTRTRWCALYGTDKSTNQQRREFLEKVEHIAEALS